MNRRVLYNRASCDVSGKPWDASRKQVWWNEAAKKWVGNDVPDFKPDSAPKDHMGPFIMNPEGVGRSSVRWARLADGPFPEFYEPMESPVANALHPKQPNNPVVKKYTTAMDKYGTTQQGFTVVCTTYRLTEHYHYWTKNNPMNVQLVPEPFVEIPMELASELGIKGGDNVKVSSARGSLYGESDGHASHPADDDRRQKSVSDRHSDSFRLSRYPGRCGQDRAVSDQFALAHGDGSERLYAGIQGLSGEAGESLMRANGPLAESKRFPGTPGRCRGWIRRATTTVAKLIDVTTCIGCKACEVACLEWNGYPFRETIFDNTYQTMPDTAWNYYNLIRFNEHVDDDGTLSWLMRKDQLHALRRSGLSACLSGRWRDCAVFQRHRRFPAG